MALPPPDPQFVLRGTSAEIHALHFSCGGQEADYPVLFSGSSSGLIHLWNLNTRRVDAVLDGHGGKSVHWVESIYARERLLSQGRDQQICLWDLAEGRNAVTDSVFTDNVGFCKCSLLKVAQGRWLLAMPGKDLGEVRVLELPSKTSVCTLKPEADAKPGMPMCLKLWQAMSVQIYGFASPETCVRIPSLSERFRRSKDSISWGYEEKKSALTASIQQKPLSFLSLVQEDSYKEDHPLVPDFGSCPFLLAGYEDGSVILWNLSGAKILSRLACHLEPVMSLDFDSGKTKGVSGSSEKVLSVWSLDEQQNLKVQKRQELINAGIADVSIRQDKKILATAGWDHRIRLFGWKKLKPLAVLSYHTATVHCVSFSDHRRPSERLLGAGSKDHRISIWSVYNQI